MQSIRERIEQEERTRLSPYAVLSSETKGRARAEEPCNYRTAFQRDRDRVVHCKAFRRLKHKTQVFIAPMGDHYRTRLTHTLEVTQIARSIARALRLNEDLTEAMSMAHDLGHTPFGHTGEDMLDKLCKGGFRHYNQSLRVVDVLERDGQGLNLTHEVRNGIVNHTGKHQPETLEGYILKFADKIAYVNHDIDDAMRAGVLSENDIPKELIGALGHTHSERIDALITNIIETSREKDEICMSPEVEQTFMALRDFMFARVYDYPKKRNEERKANYIIEAMFHHFVAHPEQLPEEYRAGLERWETDRIVCDYIAGMSDDYAVSTYNSIFVPKSWTVF
ncbi:MAG: deoxyguanosinetriphosphate triphosphohydrolase [Clostridia bacterium]|nr:deoxyguanosinetriphosphate triphosphohydrolase [Clostridia bacterium]